jgi:hypothetical protein
MDWGFVGAIATASKARSRAHVLDRLAVDATEE